MTDTTVAEIETVPERASGGFTEDFIKNNVRFDPISNMFSVIDVVMVVCGSNTKTATKQLERVLGDHPKLAKKMVPHRFPKQRGKNATPVSDFPTLCGIVPHLPGKHVEEFVDTAMQVFARALGGDLQLAREIERTNAHIAGTPLQEALLEGTGALTAGPGSIVPSTGYGPGTVVQVLTREDSSRVAAARIAALKEAADAEIQEKRLAELAELARIAKDVSGKDTPGWYKTEGMKRASLSLSIIDELTRAALPDRNPAPNCKRKRPEEDAKEPIRDPPTATRGQMLAWARSDDGLWVFPTKATAKEYERLVSYPYDLTMSGAAFYCGGCAVPEDDD